MGGKVYPCTPGTLFVIEPRVAHDNYYPPSASGLEHIWLRMLADTLCMSWISITNGRLGRPHELPAALRWRNLGLVPDAFPDPETNLAGPVAEARIRLLVGFVAAYLAEQRLSPPPAADRADAHPHSQVVDAICRHIDQTAGRDVTLDFLAHFSGYSKFHLSRLFRRHAGCTIHQYIDTARQRRMAVLRADGATNQAISDELGFSDPTAYLRWRKQKTT